MKSEFLLAFNQICSERNLSREVVLEALQTALVSAYRRNINASSAQNIAAEIDGTTGMAKIYVEKEVVEAAQDDRTEVSLDKARQLQPEIKVGETLMVESTPEDFGRIAAQTAKQVILQRIREAERDALYNNFSEREGEIINGTVQSITGQGATLNLGRTEAMLPKNQQVPGEKYSVHQRLRAYVLEVRKTSRGPQIIVSRNHKNMLRRLLELEVPEIFNGAVEIKSIAREAGARSKIAVAAKQAGVDPVGSCVGMKGVRIQSIVSELGGEKIDVIEWNADPSLYIQKALSPARVLTVHPEEDPAEGRTAIVVVPDDQLSLAIGREGQNARLAAKLTGWRIDIKSASEAAGEALRRAKEPEMTARLPEPVRNLLPTAEAVMQRHAEQPLPWNTEEMQVMRQVMDAVHKLHSADRAAAKAVAAAAKPAAPVKAAPVEQPEVASAIARIPPAAFQTRIAELGLSTRVQTHLEKAGLQTVGQVLERLAVGNEAILSLDGMGPKGLAEIKAQIEAKGLGFVPVAAAPQGVVEPAQAEGALQAVETVQPAEGAREGMQVAAEPAQAIQPEHAPAEAVAASAGQPSETKIGEPAKTAPAEGIPQGKEPAPATKTEEAAIAAGPVAPPIAPPLVPDVDEEEEEDGEGGKKDKKKKAKGRKLVFDERLGAVVARRERKPGRTRGVWEEEE